MGLGRQDVGVLETGGVSGGLRMKKGISMLLRVGQEGPRLTERFTPAKTVAAGPAVAIRRATGRRRRAFGGRTALLGVYERAEEGERKRQGGESPHVGCWVCGHLGHRRQMRVAQ